MKTRKKQPKWLLDPSKKETKPQRAIRGEEQKRKQQRIASREARIDAMRATRDVTVRRQPKLDAALALDFVKLLASGCPPDVCLQFLEPKYFQVADGKQKAEWLKSWINDPLLLVAQKEFNGGDWHELENDKRLQLSLDKHLSELAYCLFANSYSTVTDGTVLRKMETARTVLMEWMKGKGDQSRTAWEQFMIEQLKAAENTSGNTHPVYDPNLDGPAH